MKFEASYKCGFSEEYDSVPQYIGDQIGRSDHSSGQIEDLDSRSQRSAEILGRLIETLHEKGILASTDILPIVEGREGDFVAPAPPPPICRKCKRAVYPELSDCFKIMAAEENVEYECKPCFERRGRAKADLFDIEG